MRKCDEINRVGLTHISHRFGVKPLIITVMIECLGNLREEHTKIDYILADKNSMSQVQLIFKLKSQSLLEFPL